MATSEPNLSEIGGGRVDSSAWYSGGHVFNHFVT